jgi:hypothetical protein
MKWMIIIVLASVLSLNGCADTADAEDSTAITPIDNQESTDSSTDSSDDATIWAAIVMTWNPVIRTIDKEFDSEVACWNYYEGGVGEGKFGTQHLDHQNNPPTKDFNFGPDYLEYPIRTYRGKDGQGSVWLTCDIKSRYEDL